MEKLIINEPYYDTILGSVRYLGRWGFDITIEDGRKHRRGTHVFVVMDKWERSKEMRQLLLYRKKDVLKLQPYN